MESYFAYLERISIPDSFAYSLEECNHVFSDFFPANANGDLLKICFRCKCHFGKHDFLKYKKQKRKRIFDIFKNINNLHIDLFW